MGLVGTFGGPVGAGVATAYFAIDFLIGWENIGRAAVNLVSSRNESGPESLSKEIFTDQFILGV
jgi:hypothetical protein